MKRKATLKRNLIIMISDLRAKNKKSTVENGLGATVIQELPYYKNIQKTPAI
jgi:hypothetical protein